MMNNKQMAWSRSKVHSATMKEYRMLNFILVALLCGIAIGMAFSGEISVFFAGQLIAGGAAYATIIGFGNINGDVDGPEKVGKRLKSRLYYIEASQVDPALAFPSVNASRELGNIPLLNGEYWHYIDTILDSPKINSKGSMGDIAPSLVNGGTFVLGGLGNDVLDLLEKGIGKGFYFVWDICQENGTTRLISGNGCKPAKLKEFTWDSDDAKTAATITIENECGKLWLKYTGTTATLAPATVAADATTIALTSNPSYQLTDGTAAAAVITEFTGESASDIGRCVTIYGSGGDHPSTIPTGNSFIVSSTWTALANAQITFKIYKDAATYKYVEQSRIGGTA